MSVFRDLNVYASSTHYAFTSPSSIDAPTLVVDRPSGSLRLNEGKLTVGHRVSSICGILGLIKLRLDSYLIVITKATCVGRIKGHQIYRVAATEFMPLRERQLTDDDEDKYLALLKKFVSAGAMYFSYSFDVTNTFQRQAQSNAKLPLWQRADDRFFWNRFVCSSLIDFRQNRDAWAVDPYILPVMFGMLEVVETSIKGNPLTFVLTTRRSRFRAGTRYMSRGIDEEGHVSNFNETEQSVILNPSNGLHETQVFSYVQTRGSVPAYWAEINQLHYTPTLQIRGVESALPAAKLHFDEQVRLYGETYVVNLVNQKGREQRVKEAYEEIVRGLDQTPVEAREAGTKRNERFNIIEPGNNKGFNHVHYIYFDFHNETKGLKWHRAELLLDRLRPGLEAGGYFHGVDMPSSGVDVRNRQTAVVRTNCMDCLDRTNVVQSMLGRWALTRMLQDVGILQPNEPVSSDDRFEFTFRNIWADNADVVSASYSGTGALKTDFTRTGNRTRVGAAKDLSNSITRYVRNNFTDGPRQDAFDLFLGVYQPDSQTNMKFIDRRPLIIQAIPYIHGFCLFFVALSATSSRSSLVWPFAVLCLGTAGYTAAFMGRFGVLYVNWPNLNPPAWALEAYQDTLYQAARDPVFGRFMDRPEISLEEGKKRID
ncbi:hypothetical protein K470DRAFT_259719 [Piedraia hortae CBS 480.64]|uniref:SAC domain-containing protein n=1 Tax=Piedraia hortae CBS 480.64 TaxID=1314780 RepID=A0A6A7BTK3_9PEZI|nr:hypothetical protein K470DRAFT_259719 [Piedraia hortae CBS 480.64]